MNKRSKTKEVKRSTFKVLFYLNRSKRLKDGSMPIVCRISVDGKSESLSTGQKCRDEDWDKFLKMPKSKTKQKVLQELKAQIEDCYQALLQKEGVVSANLLKLRVQSADAPLDSLEALGAYELEEIRLSVGHTRCQATYENKQRFHRRLLSFIAGSGLSSQLRSVDRSFYDAYKLYLKGLGYRACYIQSNLMWLSRLMYLGVRKGCIRVNPFEGIRHEKIAPRPRYLHRGAIETVLQHPMLNPTTEQVRRLFLFSCFTGLSSCDARSIEYSDIYHAASGQAYIRISRKKTKVQSLIPLHPIAQALVEAQAGQGQREGQIFPGISRDMSSHLKCIAMACGLREELTSHMARHSFGTLSLSAGIPLESIAKMMGHKSVRSTQIYARVTDQKISEDIDRLIERQAKAL